jgi:hypothetical protein
MEEMDEGETERKLLLRLRQMCWDTVDRIGFELLKSWRFVWSNKRELSLYLQVLEEGAEMQIGQNYSTE